jgi:ribosomal-protein-alanine N-acetyltransferase
MKKALTPLFRQLAEKDLIEIYSLDQLCYEQGISYSLQTIFLFYYYFDHISYVVEVEDRLVGFIMTNMINKNKAHLITLDVHPDFRRKGLGSRLLKMAEEEVKKKRVNNISLEVDIENYPAIKLYEKFGFSKTKILKNYYKKCRDAYLMEKDLRIKR